MLVRYIILSVKQGWNLLMIEHTLTKQSWKKRRRREAPIRFSLEIADSTTGLIVEKRLGHEYE